MENSGKGFGIASLVCGIISLICCCFGFTFIVGVAGIILGVLGIVKAQQGKKTMAIVGLILSVLGAVFGLIILIFFAGFKDIFMNIDYEYFSTLSPEEQQAYIENLMRQYGYALQLFLP